MTSTGFLECDAERSSHRSSERSHNCTSFPGDFCDDDLRLFPGRGHERRGPNRAIESPVRNKTTG